MKNSLVLGDFELRWLDGGAFELDGGTAFGPVPKALWGKKYPFDADNYISIPAWPILIKTPQALILLESGLGNKLSIKQKEIFRIREEWSVLRDLHVLGLTSEDIDFVILTHFDWDHSAGVVMLHQGKLQLTFPRARHIVQKTEWEDVQLPNKRSIHTYWPINIDTLTDSGNLELVDGEVEVVSGIKVALSGGHTRGHQIVVMESRGQSAIHLGDLLPTHAHYNPLWVTGYDNFPLDSIKMKERFIQEGVADNSWFTFYQDAYYLACKFDERGIVVDRLTSASAGEILPACPDFNSVITKL